MADPADSGTIQVWVRRVGLRERMLARLLVKETGVSLGRRRQQLSIMLLLQWPANRAWSQQVADDLDYESSSSFVSIFDKGLGAPPGCYMAATETRLLRLIQIDRV